MNEHKCINCRYRDQCLDADDCILEYVSYIRIKKDTTKRKQKKYKERNIKDE